MPSFKHSGDVGDVIYSIPIFQQIGAGTLYLNSVSYIRVHGLRGLTDQSIAQLIPLLEVQPCLKSIKSWRGEKFDYDIDLFRKRNGFLSRKNLCHFIIETFGVSTNRTAVKWLQAPVKKVSQAVFNRTPRYQNSEAPKVLRWYLRNYPDSVFVGHKEEWENFCKEVGNIKYYHTKDFLEIASVINGCELFLGNQSSPMAIAIALKKQIVQEVYKPMPDCVFPYDNIKYIIEPKTRMPHKVQQAKLSNTVPLL